MNEKLFICKELIDDLFFIENNQMNILITWNPWSGKDTVCHLINKYTSLSRTSSSMYAFYLFLRDDVLSRKYETQDEAILNKDKDREIRNNAIKDYNLTDSSRLAREIMKDYNIYNWMRSKKEFYASEHLFDLIIHVERVWTWKKFNEIWLTHVDMVIPNNWELDDLERKVKKICKLLVPAKSIKIK